MKVATEADTDADIRHASNDAAAVDQPRLTKLEGIPMIKYALFVRLEAKPGKEQEVAEFLNTGLALAKQEVTTPIWFALKLSPSTFGVFDAFENEAGRQNHLQGPIAQALMAKADQLFARPPSIEPIDVLGLKNRAQAS